MTEPKEIQTTEGHECRPGCQCGTLLCGELRVDAKLFKPGQRLKITIEVAEEDR